MIRHTHVTKRAAFMSRMETVFAPRLVASSEAVKMKPVASRPNRVERASRTENLELWHRVTLASVRSDAPDLSARQLAMLMTIYLETGPHTVRSLAAHLQVTKAAISRATDSLCKMGYIVRQPDHRDKRSVVLARTSAGIHFLSSFADIIQAERP